MQLPGTPSDEVADVLATGRGDISTIFVSMATRHPDGTDAEYLRWHTLDHRPEQHRLSAVRASLRLVSTPACRRRAPSNRRPLRRHRPRDDVLLQRSGGLDGIPRTVHCARRCGPQVPSTAPGRTRCLRRAEQDGRASSQGRSRRAAVVAHPRRLPAVGTGASPPTHLIDVEGVAGVWSATSQSVDATLASARQVSRSRTASSTTTRFSRRNGCCRFSRSGGPKRDVEPLFAAPFHTVVPHEWDRYVP